MQNIPRRFLPAMFGSAIAMLVGVTPALAMDPAIHSQATMGLSQVQQLAASGQLTPNQANDLINRYNKIITNNQQWAIQMGGTLNGPDRRSLNSQLNKAANLTQNFLRDNGTTFGANPALGFTANNWNGYNGNFANTGYGYMNNNGASCGGGRRHPGRGHAYGHYKNKFKRNFDPYNTAYGMPVGNGLVGNGLVGNGLVGNGLLGNGAYANAYGNVVTPGFGYGNGSGLGGLLNGVAASGMLNSGSGIGGALGNLLNF